MEDPLADLMTATTSDCAETGGHADTQRNSHRFVPAQYFLALYFVHLECWLSFVGRWMLGAKIGWRYLQQSYAQVVPYQLDLEKCRLFEGMGSLWPSTRNCQGRGSYLHPMAEE